MPKIAFVYDRVNTPFGGAENVLVALHHIFPDAPLFTSVYDSKRANWAKDFQVIPSWLQNIPWAKKFHRAFVPLMPLAFESLDLSEYDIVISITSAEAKGVLTKPNQLHICYLLTPTRYLWSHTQEYQQHWLTGEIRQDFFNYLRWWDEAASLRPDVYIPISNRVSERCQKYYGRKTAEVIYPPVELPDDGKDVKNPENEPYYLVVSRLVSYKRIDLAIETCQKLGRNLIIIGQGPDYSRLKNRIQMRNTTANIKILQAVHSDQLIAYYKYCTAFLLPAQEDFGITALEAQSYGKPVIIYSKSGAAEIVEDSETGIHIFEQTEEALREAILHCEFHTWPEEKIKKNVAQYSTTNFQKKFKTEVEKLWQQFEKHGRIKE